MPSKSISGHSYSHPSAALRDEMIIPRPPSLSPAPVVDLGDLPGRIIQQLAQERLQQLNVCISLNLLTTPPLTTLIGTGSPGAVYEARERRS